MSSIRTRATATISDPARTLGQTRVSQVPATSPADGSTTAKQLPALPTQRTSVGGAGDSRTAAAIPTQRTGAKGRTKRTPAADAPATTLATAGPRIVLPPIPVWVPATASSPARLHTDYISIPVFGSAAAGSAHRRAALAGQRRQALGAGARAAVPADIMAAFSSSRLTPVAIKEAVLA